MRARFLAAVRAELLAEIAAYGAGSSSLGQAFSRAVRGTVRRALAFPLSGSPATAQARRLVVPGFPFSLIYRPEPDGIVVFALAHHARPPRAL